MGYKNIQTTGFDFMTHGEEDWSTTGFVAISSTGKRVTGAVSDKGPINFFDHDILCGFGKRSELDGIRLLLP